jgi:acyl-coenzyme A synthetase/AMP-(fatty) acid ligase
MGDLGYIDQEGYVWLCGRKSHRVKWQERTYFPLCVEGIFNTCPLVQRSALSSNPHGPVLWVILDPEYTQNQTESQIQNTLLDWSKKSPITQGISQFHSLKRFPVDTRHNAKIKRELLTQWAYDRTLPNSRT